MTDTIDFLIIGGGVGGTSAGAFLSKHGSVTLLESEDALAYHASGRSAALFEQSYGKPSTVDLNRASRQYHQDAGVLSPRGLMLVGTASDTDAFDADMTAMGLTRLSGTEAAAHIPILDTRVVDRAGYHADCYDIDTDRLIQGYAKTIRDAGGTIATKSRVLAIERLENGWRVITKTADFYAKTVVNAAGPWADQVAVMAGVAPIGLQGFRRSMGRIPAPANHDVSDWPMTFGAGEAWYFKPDAGALIVSPAEEHAMDPHDAFADDMVLAEGFARYEAHVTEPVTRLLSSWAGLRTFSPDRTLVLGPDPTARDFIWCAGQGGYGIQSSPAAGRLVAALTVGDTPELDASTVAALHPARFRQ